MPRSQETSRSTLSETFLCPRFHAIAIVMRALCVYSIVAVCALLKSLYTLVALLKLIHRGGRLALNPVSFKSMLGRQCLTAYSKQLSSHMARYRLPADVYQTELPIAVLPPKFSATGNNDVEGSGALQLVTFACSRESYQWYYHCVVDGLVNCGAASQVSATGINDVERPGALQLILSVSIACSETNTNIMPSAGASCWETPGCLPSTLWKPGAPTCRPSPSWMTHPWAASTPLPTRLRQVMLKVPLHQTSTESHGSSSR